MKTLLYILYNLLVPQDNTQESILSTVALWLSLLALIVAIIK